MAPHQTEVSVVIKPVHILVLLVIVLLLFGAKKLPEIAGSVGKSMKVFKKEVKELRDDDDPSSSYAATGGQPPQSYPQPPAGQAYVPPGQVPGPQPNQYAQPGQQYAQPYLQPGQVPGVSPAQYTQPGQPGPQPPQPDAPGQETQGTPDPVDGPPTGSTRA